MRTYSNHLIYPALAALICALLMCPCALAEDEGGSAAVSAKQAQQDASSDQDANAPEPEQSLEPEQSASTEDEAQDAGGSQSGSVQVEPARQDTQAAAPSDESTGAQQAQPAQYSARWTDGALPGQTVNYIGQLVMGEGAELTILPRRDIALTRNGEEIGSPNPDDVSYSSGGEHFVTVSSSGLVCAQTKGQAAVYVTVNLPDGGQKQLRQEIKVVDAPELSFTTDYAVLDNGDAADLSQFAASPILKASPNVNASVRYFIDPDDGAVTVDPDSGEVAVLSAQPGAQYRVTAGSYSGSEAVFTIYIGSRADRIEITAAGGEALSIAPGGRLQLSAVAYAGAETAALQQFSWQILQEKSPCEIDENGLLTARDSFSSTRSITVRASARDGGGAYADMEIALDGQAG